MQRMQELLKEARDDFAAADAAQRAAYRELLAFVKGTERQRLEAAQAAWLRFRDANGEFEAEFLHSPRSGAIYRLGSKARLSEERAKHLKDQLDARKAR